MADLNAFAVLGLIGTIILVGLAGEWIFKKTGVTSVLILIGMGIVLGPLLGWVNTGSIQAAVPYFGTLALLIILFDGGLNLKIGKVIRETPFALLFTTLVFAATTVSIAVIWHLFFQGPWMQGFMLGCILGGTTGAIIIIPLVSKLKGLSDDTRVLLSLEAAFTDVFVIFATLALIGLFENPTASGAGLVRLVVHEFLIAFMLSVVAGILWARFMGMLKGESLSYMLTFAAILLLASLANFLGASPAVTILLFGLVLGNMEDVVAKTTRHVKSLIGWDLDVAHFAIDVFLKRLNEEISFLVRTFFYVLLGVIFDLGTLTGLVLVGAVLMFLAGLTCRWIVTNLLAFVKRSWGEKERRLIVAMLPRGLATAVMAFVPASMGVPGTDTFPLFALLIIGFSVLYMTGAMYVETRPAATKEEAATDAVPEAPVASAHPAWVIFTDLDGTLLDVKTYRYDAARPALDLIREQRIPLILCTSKTRAEVEPLRKALDNPHPFIVENGGALYIPEDYFKQAPANASLRDGFHVIEFGVPYAQLRQGLQRIEKQVGIPLRGFGDLTLEEIAQQTGLPHHEAELARRREYDEPFLIGNNTKSLEEIREAAAQLGLTVVSGGPFLHLVGGTDRGRACCLLIDLYRQERGDVRTAALGNGWNDLPMLEAVEHPFLIQPTDGSHQNGLKVENLTHLKGTGPEAWKEGVFGLLKVNDPAAAANPSN